jgi:class 3 adenylate cyclase/TolB-like protein/Tfp pilus assembly protein PilF
MTPSQENSTRKLAAIMFTDIKAFSWKMATNEIAAMQILMTHDRMMKESIEKAGGRVIKSIGDSFMVDFPSAVNGVQCAIELQERFWEHNKGKTEFEKIEVRMGLHLGDVIDVGNDMYGDGVNIASRVEAATEPNRICITQDIYSQIKKKMQNLKVFAIGPMRFKNIDDPVDVFEILMEKIPELSTPSATAKQAPSRKMADQTAETEAKEAKSVEAKKRKMLDQVQEKIKVHYKKAEIYFEKGMLDQAEAELAEIEKLSASGATTSTTQKEKAVDKEEDDKQKKIQGFYKKAEEEFRKGNLDDAEKAIQEIYRLVPIHYGSQMIMAQIEEARFRNAEERRQKIESERRAMQKKTEQLDDLKKKILAHIDRGEYADALQATEEMFDVDPENTEAKALQEQARQLQQEKTDRERSSAEEAERIFQQTMEKRAEQAKAAEPKLPEVVVEKPGFNRKLALQIGGGIAAVVVLYFLGTSIKASFFPNTASLAVIAVGNSQDDASNSLSSGLASLLSEDFARQQHVSVISSYSALLSGKSGKSKQEIANELNVRQLVLVKANPDGAGISVTAELFDVDRQVVWSETLKRNDMLQASDIRKQIVLTVLGQLDVQSNVEDFPAFSKSADANESYLAGRALLEQKNLLSIERAIDAFSSALQQDNSFALASAGRAAASVELYKLEGETNNELLNSALRDLQTAMQAGNPSALACGVFGEVSRYRQKFADAKDALNKSLAIQPGSAACYRQLALISIEESRFDQATEQANQAMALDPKNPETLLVAGLVAHFKKDYDNALKYYTESIALGASDSLITVRYRLSVWASLQMRQEAEDYCKKMEDQYPSDYRPKYWLARVLMIHGEVTKSKPYLDEALAITEKLREKNKNDLILHGYIVLIKARLGKLDDAQKEIELAILMHGSSPEILYRRADVYAIQGEKGRTQTFNALKEAAKAEFNFAEILSPDFIAIQKDPEFSNAIKR